MDEPRTFKKWPAKPQLLVGYLTLAVMVFGIGYWSIGVNIAGAVVASGLVTLESDRQVVQHAQGGVVGAVLARDGDAVAAGDVLLRFDNTFKMSELAIVEGQLVEIFARAARLRAERDRSDQVFFDQDMPFVTPDAGWVADQFTGQSDLFDARARSVEKQTELLIEQQHQIRSLLDGMDSQKEALISQLDLTDEELRDILELHGKGLVPTNKVNIIRREFARLKGEIGRLSAESARAKQQISSIEIEINQALEMRREMAITELRDLRFSEIELSERRLSLLEQLDRMEVFASVSGTIYGSRILARRSVVQPAEPIMFVVPSDQPFQIKANIEPVHIDEVYVGQEVALRFSSFSQRTAPEIPGVVIRVSADTIADENSGISYYEAIIEPDAEALAEATQISLLPGMPVEAFIKSEDRTPLTYLTQPLASYFKRAFREQ